jgi:hypothetical protein
MQSGMPGDASIAPVLTGQCAATGGFAGAAGCACAAAAGAATAMPNDRRGYSKVASSVILVLSSFDTGQPALAMPASS